MAQALAYLAGAAAGLIAPAALACSPAPLVPSSGAIRGEACAVTYNTGEYEMVAVSKVTRLEGGFLLQDTFEGNACHGTSSMIVTDCNRGEAVILGTETFDLMQGGTSGRLDRLEKDFAKQAARGTLTLEAAGKAGARVGLPVTGRAETRDRIRMSGKSFRLDCGCKTFYPGVTPGKEG